MWIPDSMRLILLVSLALIPPSAGAATYSYEIEPGKGQDVMYTRGDPTVEVWRPGSYLSVTPMQSGKRIAFIIVVGNPTDKSFEFSERDVTAFVDEKEIKLVTAAQLRKESKRLAAAQSAAIGFAGAINAGASGRSKYSGTSTYTSKYGKTVGSAKHSGILTNSAAQQQALQQTGEQIAGIAKSRDESLGHIDNLSLERSTVPPQDSISGMVAIDAPKPRGRASPIRLIVVTGPDVHWVTIREIKD